jgi:hypothetical protein
MKTINIGLANPFTEALKCIRGVQDVAVRRSATEDTVIIRFQQAVDNLTKIATALDQDCIAVYDEDTGVGELYGDRASEWAPFNPEYFLTI